MINQAQLTAEQQRLVDAELQPGETLVWLGQPIPRRFAMSCWPIVLFGIPWTAFAVFWVSMAFLGTRQMKGNDAMSTGFKWCFPLFGVPFVLIGFGMLSAPFWAMRKARQTIYAITERRALAFEGGRGMTVRSYAPAELKQIERKQNGDGTGDIIIGRASWRDGDGDRRTTAFGFMGIPSVKEVEALLRALASKDDEGGDAPPKVGQSRA